MISVEYTKRYPFSMLLLNSVWTLVFAFFALRIDSDPESCEATDENDIKYNSVTMWGKE